MPTEESGPEPGRMPPPGQAEQWPPSPAEGAPGAMPGETPGAMPGETPGAMPGETPGETPGGAPWPEVTPSAPPEGMPGYGAPPYGAPPYGAPPYGAPPYGPAYGYPYMAPPPPMAPATSGWATASLICSIAGLCTFGLASIVGVIFGHIALSEISGSQGRVEGRTLAIAGLVIGYTVIGLHLLVVIAFIAAIAATGPLQ